MKKFAFTISMAAALTATPIAHAANNCLNVQLQNTDGQLIPIIIGMPDFSVVCGDALKSLRNSSKFPSVFSKADPVYTHFCFVSNPEGIPARLGNRNVIVHTKSVWTKDFAPYVPGLLDNGTDNMATVITEWRILDELTELPLGKVYTMDGLDVASSSELNTVVGGTGLFFNVKGAVRVDSHFDNFGIVHMDSINGKICL